MYKSKFRITSIALLLMFLMIFSSCRSGMLDSFTEDVVDGFRTEAMEAEIKYHREPEPEKANPFPASFVITGKVLILDEALGYTIPYDTYALYSFCHYEWFTEEPDEIRYVVLVEISDYEKLMYTIVDLGYDEQVYKGYTESYETLGTVLYDLTLK